MIQRHVTRELDQPLQPRRWRVLRKSNAGVKYVAKVERGGKTRYFYDESKYRQSHGRHTLQEEGTASMVARKASWCVKRHGEGGCEVAGFRDLVEEHGHEAVHAAVRSAVDSGDLEYKGGRFYAKTPRGDRK